MEPIEELGLILLVTGCSLTGIWAFLLVIFSTDVSIIIYLGIGLMLTGVIVYLMSFIYYNFPRKQ